MSCSCHNEYELIKHAKNNGQNKPHCHQDQRYEELSTDEQLSISKKNYCYNKESIQDLPEENIDFEKLQREKCEKEEKKSRNNFKNNGIKSVIFAGVVVFSYESMKQECPFDSDQKCWNEYVIPHLNLWMILILLNCVLTVFQLHLTIFKLAHKRICATAFLLQMYLFIFDDMRITSKYYIGWINAAHLICFIVILTLYMIYRNFSICFSLWGYKYIFFMLIVIIIAGTSLYFGKLRRSCDQWSQGINGEIDNSLSGMCKVQKPTVCLDKIIHKWQDVSSFVPTCQKNSQQQIKILNFYLNNTDNKDNFIGFPNSLNQQPEVSLFDNSIQHTVLNLTKTYSSLQSAQKAGVEVVLDRTNLKYIIEVQFNQTLQSQREQQAKNKIPLSKNILLIFISAVSRQSMHLKLPKTMQWFKDTSVKNSYDENRNQTIKETQLNSSESFEFYRFNSFMSNTSNTLQSVYFGEQMNKKLPKEQKSLPEELKFQSIFEDFKRVGFVTGFASDQCSNSGISFSDEEMKFMKSICRDHESYSFNCDPNYKDPENKFTLFQGPDSIVRRCLYDHEMSEYAFEYANSFFKKYNNSNKVMQLELNYGNENTGEVITYLDDSLSSFLSDFSKSKEFNDTTVILFSDHGLHKQTVFNYLGLQNQPADTNLPGLFITLPTTLNQQFRNSIAINQQTLVTPINLHHFLKHLSLGANYQFKELSLLSPLTNQLQCIQADIQDAYCSCK